MNLKQKIKNFYRRDIFLNKNLPIKVVKNSMNDLFKNNELFFDNMLDPLLFFYLKAIKKKYKINLLLRLPNLINIQQLSFKKFLKTGIMSALENQNPLQVKNKLHSFEIFYFSNYLQFKKSKNALKQAIILKKTYGCHIYVPVLIKPNIGAKLLFDWVKLGFLPFMTKSGHFLINGIPRVAINQLVRAPGIYKLIKNAHTTKGIQPLPQIRLVPDKGSWISINFDSRNRLWITTKIFINKVSYLVFLQALGIDIKKIFQQIKNSEILLSSIVPPLTSTNKDNYTRHDIILAGAGLSSHPRTQLEACKYLYSHFLEYNSSPENKRPAITEKKAFLFFWQVIWNSRNKYLGHLGRRQMIKKLEIPYSSNHFQITNQDFVLLTQTIINLLYGKEIVDDIDNLDNKKIRSCEDFLYQELLRGINEFEALLDRKFKKFLIAQKKALKLNQKSFNLNKTVKNNKFFVDSKSSEIIINYFWRNSKFSLSKMVTRAWRDFFIGGTLSQYLDEINPLAEITHKRRLTFLGPGGVNSKQTTIKIRGIHPTYYGRICPIETPEGQNAGLVHSLTVFSQKTYNGSIITPYYKTYKGQVQTEGNFSFLNSEKESLHIIAAADIILSKWKRLPEISLPVRKNLNFDYAKLDEITTQSISVLQMISLATSLIPFLEHNDANRALMGSNMQRQAVTLVRPEVALVKTGLEVRVTSDIRHTLQTQTSGFVIQAISKNIVLYKPKTLNYYIYLDPFFKFSEIKYIPYTTIFSCNHLFFSLKSPVKFNKIKQHFFYLNIHFNNNKQFLYYNNNIKKYKNLLNNFKFNTPSEHLYLYPSNFLLLKKFVNKNINYSALSKKYITNYKTFNFDVYKRTNQSTCTFQRPLVQEANWVEESDILVDGGASIRGKLAIGKNLFIAYLPWEGYNFEDAVIISENLVSENIFTSLHLDYYQIEVQNTATGLEIITKDVPLSSEDEIIKLLHLDSRGIVKKGTWIKEGDYLVGKVSNTRLKGIPAQYEKFYYDILQKNKIPAKDTSFKAPKGAEGLIVNVEILPPKKLDLISLAPKNSILCVKLSILQRRKVQIGDKVAGRHGNKGVISKILPSQDMPYLPDGTPIDIILNPLGIPSRMNVGQILESLLGLAGKYLNESFDINLFDEKFGTEASRSFVYSKLYKASLITKNSWLFDPQHPGKIKIFDGRTGIAFKQPITVGYTYMLKLVHMVDDKIHARATGPYSALTQQPVRGRARNGGQRLGEMEVWALQAYGAAFTLQELMTIKSDDIDGRNSAVLQIFLNKPIEIKQPESIKLLLREIQALCINLEIFTSSSNKKKFCLVDLNNIDNALV